MLAIEVGSSYVRAARPGQSPSYCEPSLVARDANTLQTVACGQRALELQSGAPGSVQFVRPVRGGQIRDWEAAVLLIRQALTQVHGSRGRATLAMAVPAALSLVQRRAWKQLGLAAGAAAVELLESPFCAAVGCGCDLSRPVGRLLLDWGGGGLDLGLLSGSTLLATESAACGGLELDEAIQRCVRQQHGVLISLTQAEEVKQQLLSALPRPGLSRSMEITGFGAVDGLPRSVRLTPELLHGALQPYLLRVQEALLSLLGHASPELCADLLAEGLWLCGGVGQLRDFDVFLEQISGLRVLTVESPQEATIRGLSDWVRSRN